MTYNNLSNFNSIKFLFYAFLLIPLKLLYPMEIRNQNHLYALG